MNTTLEKNAVRTRPGYVLELPTFDLTHVIERIRQMRPELTSEQLAEAEEGYRKYCSEVKENPKAKMQPPTRLIDDVWHTHIFLSTRQYAADCEAYFGYFLHHAAICDAGGCSHDSAPQHHINGQV